MASEDGGFFLTYRSLTDPRHDLHPYSRGEAACAAFAWQDLIGYARWKESGGLNRGQLRASLSFLATRWNWSRKKVQRFLHELEEKGRIQLQRGVSREPTRITICNYDTYQLSCHTNDATGDPTNDTTSDHQEEVRNKKQEERDTTVDASASMSNGDELADRPHTWMHDIWHDELGLKNRRIKLTPKRRTKYKKMWDEQLAETSEPKRAWKMILKRVQMSDHHMSERAYQMPESLLRNAERREQWVERTLDLAAKRTTNPATQRAKAKAERLYQYLEETEDG